MGCLTGSNFWHKHRVTIMYIRVLSIPNRSVDRARGLAPPWGHPVTSKTYSSLSFRILAYLGI